MTQTRYVATAKHGEYENTETNVILDVLGTLGGGNFATVEAVQASLNKALADGKASAEWATPKYYRITVEEVPAPSFEGQA